MNIEKRRDQYPLVWGKHISVAKGIECNNNNSIGHQKGVGRNNMFQLKQEVNPSDNIQSEGEGGMGKGS